MASTIVIVKSLEDAVQKGDGQVLKDSYDAINLSLASQSTQRVGLHALVLCAEAALKVGHHSGVACMHVAFVTACL